MLCFFVASGDFGFWILDLGFWFWVVWDFGFSGCGFWILGCGLSGFGGMFWI